MKRHAIFASLLAVGLATSAWAATPGTVAIDPFDLGTSASIAGVGGASSTVGGLWSLAHNPAGLADIKHEPKVSFYEFQVGVSYLRWFEEQSVGYGALALPPGFAIGAANFDQGTITTTNGFLAGPTEKVSDFGAIAGYGTSLPGVWSNVSVGVSAQYWQRNLAEFKASTFAVNLGARVFLLDQQLAFGAYVQNLGPSLKFETEEKDKQPLGVTVGAAWAMPATKPVRVRVVADVVKPRDQDVFGAGGAELILQDVLALRGGLSSARDKTHPTFGVGVNYAGFSFDYAYAQVSLLSEDIGTHLVSLSFGLGGTK